MNNESLCHQLESCIVNYVGGTLASEEKRLMDDHVHTCGRCCKMVEDVRIGHQAFSTLPRASASRVATDRIIEEAVAKHLGGSEAIKRPASLVLTLKAISASEWEIEDVDTKVRLADYLIELHFRDSTGQTVRAVMVSISDPHFELQPSGYAMAAGDLGPLQQAEIRFTLPDDSSGCLDIVQDRSGSFIIRGKTLQLRSSIQMTLTRREKSS